jgi:HEAT repeat protein
VAAVRSTDAALPESASEHTVNAELVLRRVRRPKQLMDLSRDTDDEEAAVAATWLIGRLRLRGSSHWLLGLLLDPFVSRQVRLQAGASLASTMTPRFSVGLVKNWHRLAGADADQTRLTLYALGFGGYNGAANLLLAYLRDRDSPETVRAQAAESLGHLFMLGLPKAVEIALLPCIADPSPEVRFWVCFALATGSPERAAPALERLLGDASLSASGETVASEAAWALTRIAGDSSPTRS